MQEPWLMQEINPGLKPDWLAEIKPLSTKKPNIRYIWVFQKLYHKLEVKALDDSFFKVCLLPFLCIGRTSAFLNSHGYIPLSMQWLKMSLNDLQMEVLHIFIMRMLILSWPCALFRSSFAIILCMSSLVILTEDNLSFVL